MQRFLFPGITAIGVALFGVGLYHPRRRVVAPKYRLAHIIFTVVLMLLLFAMPGYIVWTYPPLTLR
jgi:uncharacterized membrane protein YqjE